MHFICFSSYLHPKPLTTTSPGAASSGIPQWQLAVGDLTLRLRDEIQRAHEKEKEYLTQLLQDALLSRDKKISVTISYHVCI